MGALQNSADRLGHCTYEEVTNVLEMYEHEMFTVSPTSVNASVCFGKKGLIT